MYEPEVVLKVRALLQAQGFKLKGQPDEGDVTLLNESIRVDLQGFRNASPPDLLWVECKGGETNLKDLLCDFISLLLVLNEYGGQAILACPSKEYCRLMEHKEFLDKLQQNIAKGSVTVIDVEKA